MIYKVPVHNEQAFFYAIILGRDLNIVFMGTPDFAVPSLKILLDNGFNIVGVITSPENLSENQIYPFFAYQQFEFL